MTIEEKKVKIGQKFAVAKDETLMEVIKLCNKLQILQNELNEELKELEANKEPKAAEETEEVKE
jgi:hypothetical protein